MGESYTVTVVKEEVVHKGKYNVSMFYEALHRWFVENKFLDESGGDDYLETYYYEDRSSAKEIYFRWRSKKGSDSKYFNYTLNLDVHIVGLKEVEAVINGKKMTLDSGEITLNIESKMTMDLGDLPKNPLVGFFYRLFLDRWLKSKFEFYKDELKDKTLSLIGFIKSYFGIPGSKKEPSFTPPLGIDD
ncbi:MAG: hypothetical protein PWP03_531 [Candidatus Woesearchaeota archaeon]|nr:hypothetical protein [Candidatus Woesearchaeota archaeon]MDN5327893.1 hypothetical protein [Candidatus Woesearchaeota archaeon]